MNKLICMGECLVDMLPQGNGLSFDAKAGGAPANVCACVAKLGAPAYYLGKMSNDLFGKFLFEKLVKCGVKTDFVTKTDSAKTALAFVVLGANGEREFSFYRDMTADMMLSPKEIDGDMFENGDILHFCSVALMPSPTKDAHKKAIEEASKRGALISFDVNVRLPLWKTEQALKDAIDEFLPYADILKVSDDELAFVSGEKRESDAKCESCEGRESVSTCNKLSDDELAFVSGEKRESDAIASLFAKNDRLKLVFVTKGKDGVSAYNRDGENCFAPSHSVRAIDTTGAGDCFIGCVLYKILANTTLPNTTNNATNYTTNDATNYTTNDATNYTTNDATDETNIMANCSVNTTCKYTDKNAKKLDFEYIKSALSFATRGAAVVVTKMGAMEAMPTQEEIKLI